MIENRRTFRLPLRTKFLFSNENIVMVANSVNISSGGIFVTTLTNPALVRGAICHSLFVIDMNEPPINIQVQIKRIVANSINPDEVPGIGFEYLDPTMNESKRVNAFIDTMRRRFEYASTILSSGEPDLVSLSPLIDQMHLPPYQDLSELRLMIERVLKSIELVEKVAGVQD
jgi:hypothetical protein